MSTIAIAGGHGKIALLLGQLLAERGDTIRGLIRSPDQEGDLRAVGVEPVLCDLEGDGDVAAAVRGAGAVVFAAGAGPGSGEARKASMDLANPKVQEWETIMHGFQHELPEAKPGEKWLLMERVFDLAAQ